MQERNHRRNDVPRKGICPSAETTCFAERMAHTVLWRRRDVPTRIACYATIITDTSSHHSPYLSLFLFLYLVRRSLTLPPRSHSFSRSVFSQGPFCVSFVAPFFFVPSYFFLLHSTLKLFSIDDSDERSRAALLSWLSVCIVPSHSTIPHFTRSTVSRRVFRSVRDSARQTDSDVIVRQL